jgi:ribonucleoside-diphosphate reductase alpha chain
MEVKPITTKAVKKTDARETDHALYEKLMNRTRPGQEPESIPEEDPVKGLKVHTMEAAMAAATAYFKGDTLAANVWVSKYALKNSAGDLFELTPDDMHRRLARELARIERKYPNPMDEELIFSLLQNFKYIIPQGSPMAGIGNDFQIGSLCRTAS